MPQRPLRLLRVLCDKFFHATVGESKQGYDIAIWTRCRNRGAVVQMSPVNRIPLPEAVMDLANYLTYCLALAVAIAIPGPGVVALVARSLGSGARATVPMMLGMALGDIVYLAAAILGLAYIAATFGSAFAVIRYLGAAYLLYLAWKLFRASVDGARVEVGAGQGALSGFMAGFAITLGNPKVIVFYLALLPTFLDLSQVTPVDMVALILLTFTVLMAVLLPYILLAGRARHALRTPRALKLLNRVAGGFLTGAAVFVVAKSA